MKREELIKKWLDNELSVEEYKAFNALEDFDALVKLSDNVKKFKAPEYQTSEGLKNVLYSINTSQSHTRNWVKPLLRVAAVIAIMFSVYYYTTTLDTNVATLVAQKTSIELPDASSVSLNALSTLTYNKKAWRNNRDIELNGEAFFKVNKGSTFNVNTASGTVTVLGTEFNVKHRENLFEVVCYEGSVSVTYKTNTTILKPGDSFLILDGEIIAKEKETATNPSWINNQSRFNSIPFEYVLLEFERQYNVTVTSQDLDLDQLFTGSFIHNDKILALKSITLPLNLKYRLVGDTSILLSGE